MLKIEYKNFNKDRLTQMQNVFYCIQFLSFLNFNWIKNKFLY